MAKKKTATDVPSIPPVSEDAVQECMVRLLAERALEGGDDVTLDDLPLEGITDEYYAAPAPVKEPQVGISEEGLFSLDKILASKEAVRASFDAAESDRQIAQAVRRMNAVGTGKSDRGMPVVKRRGTWWACTEQLSGAGLSFIETDAEYAEIEFVRENESGFRYFIHPDEWGSAASMFILSKHVDPETVSFDPDGVHRLVESACRYSKMSACYARLRGVLNIFLFFNAHRAEEFLDFLTAHNIVRVKQEYDAERFETVTQYQGIKGLVLYEHRGNNVLGK